MDSAKIKTFMQLAGQETRSKLQSGDSAQRALGAQLLLSEVLEYVIHGLGVTPHLNATPITQPDALRYEATSEPDHEEMIDGLADVAYTMFWNSCAFGVPLEEAFELVCDNNLEKFVRLSAWSGLPRALEPSEWGCGLDVTWPPEVSSVQVLQVEGVFFAVGKDSQGKVRKPSTYTSVDLSSLVANS
jgi:hypothetical protein